MLRVVRRIGSRGAIALVLGLASCGGGGGSVDEAVVAPSSSAPAAAATEAATATTKREPLRVERPSGTPLGNVTPPQDPAYLLLSQGKCRELLQRTGTWRGQQVNDEAFFLYRAAAEACLQRWDDALRNFERLQQLDPDFSGGCDSTNCEGCMREVRRWLSELLAVRRRADDREVQLVNGTGRSPCPAGSATTTSRATTTRRS